MAFFWPLLFIAFLVPALLAGIAYVCGSRMGEADRLSPFECGFDSKSPARSPFSLRFFLLAVIFVLFDVEVALVLPLPLIFRLPFPVAAVVGAAVFLLVLLAGLGHEWREGSLDWVLRSFGVPLRMW